MKMKFLKIFYYGIVIIIFALFLDQCIISVFKFLQNNTSFHNTQKVIFFGIFILFIPVNIHLG